MKSDSDFQSPRLERFTRQMIRRRWRVLAAWSVVLVLSLVASVQLPALLNNRFAVPGTESQMVEDLLKQHFGQLSEGVFQIVVVGSDDPKISSLTVTSTATSIGKAASKSLPKSTAGTAQPVSAKASVVVVSSPLEQADAKAYVNDMRKAVAQKLPDGYRAYVTGGGAFAADLDPVLQEDLARGELFFALPVALIVLALVFGTLGFTIPFMFAIAAIPTTLGFVWVFANFFDLSSYVLNLVVGVGLGVSIDYSLLLYWRYREERQRAARGLPDHEPDSALIREAAVVRTAATAGRAVIFSGFAVAIGLALLLLMPLPFMQGFGLAGLIIPLVSVAAALTLMPVLMYLTAHRLERYRFVSKRRMEVRDSLDDNGWARLASFIMRRPVPVFVLSSGVLLALAFPATRIDLTPGSNEGLPASLESIEGVTVLSKALGEGAITPTVVVIDGGKDGAARSTPVQEATARLVGQLADDPQVLAVSPTTEDAYDSKERFIRLSVINKGAYGDNATGNFIHEARSVYVKRANFPRGSDAFVGGSPGVGVDLVDQAYGAFPWLIAAVLSLTYILLLRAFRSLLIPLKAIVLNLLSIGAAYGLLELVFGTPLGDAIGLTSFGQIEFWIPVFLFAMLFGLSMDYEVFLVSRMREFWDETHDNELAVSRGLAATGRLVTAAGIIMITAFAGFMASRPVGFQQFGLGLSTAILIDITLVRALLLPSSMRLFGRWNWWLPGGVARIFRVEPSPLQPRSDS